MVFSPTEPVISKPEFTDSSDFFSVTQLMAVEVPTTSLGRSNCYLGKIIIVLLGIPEIIKQHAVSTPLALHILVRLLSNDKLVPRKETLSLPKLEVEGTPKLLMFVLG